MSAFILAICLLVIEGKKTFKLKAKDILALMVLWFIRNTLLFFSSSLCASLIGIEGSLNIALIMASSPLLSLIVISILRQKRPHLFTITMHLSFFHRYFISDHKG